MHTSPHHHPPRYSLPQCQFELYCWPCMFFYHPSKPIKILQTCFLVNRPFMISHWSGTRELRKVSWNWIRLRNSKNFKSAIGSSTMADSLGGKIGLWWSKSRSVILQEDTSQADTAWSNFIRDRITHLNRIFNPVNGHEYTFRFAFHSSCRIPSSNHDCSPGKKLDLTRVMHLEQKSKITFIESQETISLAHETAST